MTGTTLRDVGHIGWGITPGIAATAYDMLDQAPTLSAAELAWWFGLGDEQAELLRACWQRDVRQSAAQVRLAVAA